MVIRLPHYLLLFVLSCCWVFIPSVRGSQGTCEDTRPGKVSAEQFAPERGDRTPISALTEGRGGLSRCTKRGALPGFCRVGGMLHGCPQPLCPLCVARVTAGKAAQGAFA